jgi:hypothetical protein
VSLQDTLANSAHAVLSDDKADRGEMLAPVPLLSPRLTSRPVVTDSVPADAGSEIFRPYSDEESEEESEEELLVSSKE